jgi:hypothetical protein
MIFSVHAPSSHRSTALLRSSFASVAREGPTVVFVMAAVMLLVMFRQLVPIGFGGAELAPARYAADVWRDFVQHAVIALGMLALLQPVRRLGPDRGAARIAVLCIAVVGAAALAATARTLYLISVEKTPAQVWPSWDLLFLRFLTLAAMFVTVGEFHRSEVRSLEGMRTAEADRAALEQETLQARLKTLEAQIEPHFLFNVLANVRRLYETDPVAGEAMFDRLMRYFEVALPSMRDDAPTLGREAQLIEAYLELQQVRMGRRLSFRIDIAPELGQIKVPPMMLLTLVENAIKHGLAPQREGGSVEISARRVGSELHLEVADTGRGFGGDTSGGGTGLANIRARLAAMFGTAAELSLLPRAPRGLVASLRMPASAG